MNTGETWREELARAQLIRLEVDRLALEARTCDPARLPAIRNEINVLYGSMLEIRREQLRREIEPDPPPERKRWWRFWESG